MLDQVTDRYDVLHVDPAHLVRLRRPALALLPVPTPVFRMWRSWQ
ncbi:hypothetical protein [Streptomyces virginiae]|nr:hypothetical protein [Streptomyces virginiae]MCX5176724.1 hypothetical protein [Streptomyces virginiae]